MRLPLLLLCLPLVSPAAVTEVRVSERASVLEGKSFDAGPYESVTGTVHFEVDPTLPANQLVRGLEYAPRNERGMVEFSADMYVLKPRDSAKSNRTLLFEVSNRGGKGLIGDFNRVSGSAEPKLSKEYGDGFLMNQGFTLVWLGWQFDVPSDPKLLRLHTVVAKGPEGPITGLVRSEFIPERAVVSFSLADRNHQSYLAADLEQADATLTVRSTPDGQRRTIPRNQWQFAREENGRAVPDRGSIYIAAGLEPGKIYEAVYRAQDPPVAGLGLAAIRDFISFLKYGGAETALSDQSNLRPKALGFGISQSGRLLRTFLYDGFNADEKGRKVFDGVWADVAGAGRGSFNVLFAQPSRDGAAFSNLFYPTDVFPFTTEEEKDPATGATGSLLQRAREMKVVPKIFFTNGSYEYWGRVASLTHITPDGKRDMEFGPESRYYFIANTRHGSGRFPPQTDVAKYPSNPNDIHFIHRALLIAMHRWIQANAEPPESHIPKIEKGELVPLKNLAFPKLPGVKPPAYPRYAWRLDYGPDFTTKGIATIEPPRLGSRYALLVPQVDELGREIGGIQTPEVQNSLGVYTGWNFRLPSTGAPDQMINFVGSYLPLPSGATVPKDKEKYLSSINRAAQDLMQEGFLLESDIPAVIEEAGKRWDYAKGK